MSVRCPSTIVFVLLLLSNTSDASVTAKAVKEAAEYVLGKFGKETAQDGLETLSRKIESLAVRHGDDALTAVTKVGPRTFRIVEEAGEHGPQAIKLLARHGDDAVWVVAKKQRLAIFVKYGDDAAEAMMKQGEIAEPLLETFGKPAASALKAIDPQNGRRLAMMANEGELARIGKTDEVLGVVGKYGDRAMDFIWKNKGSLTVAAALTAFLANPEPFLDGTKDFVKYIGEPLAAVPGQIATEAAKSVNWTWTLSLLGCVIGALIAFKMWLRNRNRAVSGKTTQNPVS